MASSTAAPLAAALMRDPLDGTLAAVHVCKRTDGRGCGGLPPLPPIIKGTYTGRPGGCGTTRPNL